MGRLAEIHLVHMFGFSLGKSGMGDQSFRHVVGD